LDRKSKKILSLQIIVNCLFIDREGIRCIIKSMNGFVVALQKNLLRFEA